MFDFGYGGTSHFQPTHTYGRVRGTAVTQGVAYPSPFFDLAHTYLPPTVKQMFKWCRYYYLTQPLIAAVVNKMAEYPITDLVIDTDNRGLRDTWERFFESDIQLRPRLIDIGLYYMCYGNALVSLSHPFVKWLKCKYCGHSVMAKKAKYRFRTYEFILSCDKCNQNGNAIVEDQYLQTSGGTKLLLWNPEDIDIVFNPITHETVYFYSLPIQTLNDMAVGRREVIEQLPQVFIDAAKKRKSITLNKDNLFHIKRPSVLSGPRDTGWGIPIVLPVLKDVFYLQVMKKAQEAILLERIVPLTVIFPQQSSGTADPYCVSHDTLIETRNGLRPSAEVTEGDFVKTHSGVWKRVERAVDRKIRAGEKVFEISIASLSAFPFKVSEDHPILAVKKTNGHSTPDEPKWINAKDLSEGDLVCYPTRRSQWGGDFSLDLSEFNPERAATAYWIYRRLSQGAAEIYEFFEEHGVPEFSRKGLPKNDRPLDAFCEEHGWTRDDFNVARTIFVQEPGVDRMPRFLPVGKELAFLIGLYAAEGFRHGTLASLSLNISEQAYVDRVDSYLQSIGCSPVSRSVRDNSLTVGVNDVLISSVLFSCGNGAANKHLPRFITEAPVSIALEAVDGVVCGDGCDFMASQGGKNPLRRIGLKTISPQLAMDVRMILLSVEVLATVQKSTPKSDDIAKADYYQVNTNGTAAERLACLLGRPHRDVAPGRSSGFFRDGYVYLRVKRIEEVLDVRVVRGFQIEGDKSFCVAGVATHNTSVNLVDWKEHIAQEIQRWRLDRNYIPILPLPIGNQVIGGDGRALLMSQEIKIWSDQIIAGMNVPNEFIYGGLQWSGSNVSLRMLENQFMRYLSSLLLFIKDFVIKGMAAHMGWPEVGVRFKPFKMADDLQRKAFLFQLNQAGKVSDTTLITDADLNADEENELMKKETKARLEAVKEQQLAEAEISGEAGVINAKYQAKAQTIMMQEQQQAAAGMQGTAPGEPGDEVGAPGVQQPEGPPQQTAQQMNPLQQLAQRLRALPPDSQRAVLSRIEQQNPELANQLRAQFRGGGSVDASPNTAGSPLPTQLPPRRGTESAMI